MRVVEAESDGGKVGVVVVPFPRDVSDAWGMALHVTNSAMYFGYLAVLVVNTDFVRAWAGSPSGRNPQLRFLWEKSASEVLGPYASEDLATAGESALAGYVERWLSDLATHWRHGVGQVPAEKELVAAGIRLAGESASASVG